MGILDRATSLLPPRLVRAASAAREAWQSAPQPVRATTAPFMPPRPPTGAPAPATPRIDWYRDQPPDPPSRFAFQPGYSDHTYQQFFAPLSFDGFGLERIRSTVTQHRLGYFFESSALMVAVMGFAPVLAALQQAIAPILALSRHIRGGDKGLSKLVAGELEDMLFPRSGLLPSPYFPPQLIGTTAIYYRMMGFCVWQHIDGDPDPDTGIRPRYTRIWEPWALNWYRSPRKLIALTTEGPVEVCNDGKFTLVSDEQEPYLSAAICALGEETLSGKLTQESRNSFMDFFGKPKIWAEMPEKVATKGETGDAFFAAVETIYGPDGRGVLPNGSKLQAVAISGEGSKTFQDALLDAIIHIYMVLTGSAGTIGSGGPTGAGPYQPQKGGPWNVRHDLVARPTIAMVRAMNQGVCAPYQDINYADAIARAKRAGAWKTVVAEIPIPQPDRDERLKSEIERHKALTDQVQAERASGAIVDQDRVDTLASRFEVIPFKLADETPKAGEIFQYHIENKLVAPDEVRARLGLPPLPNGIGSPERLAEERAAGGDEAGALAKVAAQAARETGQVEEVGEEAPPPAGGAPPVAAPPPAPEDKGPTTQRSVSGKEPKT